MDGSQWALVVYAIIAMPFFVVGARHGARETYYSRRGAHPLTWGESAWAGWYGVCTAVFWPVIAAGLALAAITKLAVRDEYRARR